MPRIDLLSLHAAEILHAPKGWAAYAFEHCGPAVKVTGAVAPLADSASPMPLFGDHDQDQNTPMNLSRSWALKDERTIATVFISDQDHEKWEIEWEKKTGKCRFCAGSGDVLKAWNYKTGITFKICSECGGTGKYRSSPKCGE